MELAAGLRTLEAPMSVMTDSYKAGHFLMYPESKSMTAYGEFREPMAGMLTGGHQDNRFVFYGMRHYIENFVARKWTKSDVDAADAFYKTHSAGGQPYPFPRDLFMEFIEKNEGCFQPTPLNICMWRLSRCASPTDSTHLPTDSAMSNWSRGSVP